MGICVYRVTADKVKVNGFEANVAKYAFKPHSPFGLGMAKAGELNADAYYDSGCPGSEKLKRDGKLTDYVAMVNSSGVVEAVYMNINKAAVFYDNALGEKSFPMVYSANEEKARIAAVLKANPEIGTLANGRFYVWPVNGAYIEATDPAELVGIDNT